MNNIKSIFENFIIKNTKYNGKKFYFFYNGKLYIDICLQGIIDQVIKNEDFFNNITKEGTK